MEEDFAALAAEAMDRAWCKGANCRIVQVVHGTYAIYLHIGQPHVCRFCTPTEFPTHVVSRDSMIYLKRDALVARVSRWLDHLHGPPDVAPPPDVLSHTLVATAVALGQD